MAHEKEGVTNSILGGMMTHRSYICTIIPSAFILSDAARKSMRSE